MSCIDTCGLFISMVLYLRTISAARPYRWGFRRVRDDLLDHSRIKGVGHASRLAGKGRGFAADGQLERVPLRQISRVDDFAESLEITRNQN